MEKHGRLGVDISFYVDDSTTPQKVDFEKMKSEGVEFLFIRAAQNLWEDPLFPESWERSRGIIPRGSYFFYDSRIPPQSQAEFYYSVLYETGDLGELPIVVDYEKTMFWQSEETGEYAGWQYLYTMIAKLKEYMPEKEIILYSGYYYLEENFVGATNAQKQWFADNTKLWLAYYSNTISPGDLPIPLNWDKIFIWQFTDSGDGIKYGVESKGIDLNYFLGSEDDWDRFVVDFGGEDNAEDNDGSNNGGDGMEVVYKGNVVAGAGVNIRSGASSSYPKLTSRGAIPYGSSVDATEKSVDSSGNEWLHVVSVDGASTDGWSVSTWYNEQTIKYSEVEVVDPPIEPPAGGEFYPYLDITIPSGETKRYELSE